MIFKHVLKTNIGVNLAEEWIRLAKTYSSDPELIDRLWMEIQKQYTEPRRAYHNLTHIEDMLQQCDKHQRFIQDFNTLRFAIWYHDIEYDVSRDDNEERSASLAVERMQELQMGTAEIRKCHQLILATKSHKVGSEEDPDFSWLLDIDLSVLGRELQQYKMYCQAIRQEYNIYPDELYNAGRKSVLQHFLKQNAIFKTPQYQDQFEQQARFNLKWELDQLSTAP